jgi:hypothetical protein
LARILALEIKLLQEAVRVTFLGEYFPNFCYKTFQIRWDLFQRTNGYIKIPLVGKTPRQHFF